MLHTLRIVWLVLVVWPVVSLAMFFIGGFYVVIVEMPIFGMEGGPLAAALNWTYEMRLWWGGPGASLIGELGTPLLSAGFAVYAARKAATATPQRRLHVSAAAACLSVVALAVCAYWVAWLHSEHQFASIHYAGSWFRIENVVGSPEIRRSPQMALYASSRWAAVLTTPLIFLSLRRRTRLASSSGLD